MDEMTMRFGSAGKPCIDCEDGEGEMCPDNYGRCCTCAHGKVEH